MAKRIVLLLVVVSLLAATVGCGTYNFAAFSMTAHMRRVAIASENLRIAHEDLDWVLGLSDYPRTGKFAR